MRLFFLACCTHIYSALIYFAGAVLKCIDYRGSLHSSERWSLPAVAQPSRENQTIWIHAASLGEAKVAFRFLPLLEKKHPSCVFVLTALSESGVNYLQSHRIPSVYHAGFMPFDTIGHIRKFAAFFSISRIWLVETEIWPGMLWFCLRKKIPVGIINGRMEEKSFALYRMFRFFLAPFFNYMDTVLVQNDAYAERFRVMGVQPEALHSTGNIKKHISVEPAPAPRKKAVREQMNITPADSVITAGCIHPGEAGIIEKTALYCSSRGYAWKWILVPRHINKTALILQELNSSVMHVRNTCATRSTWDMCIIEAFGVMEEMYLIADAAILGGTFVSVGGHNAWEPVQFGIPLFFGPDFHTQRESCEQLLQAGVGFCVNDHEELAEGIIKTLKLDTRTTKKNITLFAESMNENLHTVERYLP